jgi:soluble lytic murein transglycosylase-like protein
MNNVRQFIFPGAIAGSLILASFGYSVMARVPKPSSPLPQQQAQDNPQDDSNSDRGQSEVQLTDIASNETKPDCEISANFPQDIRQWCSQIMRHASKNNLDPNLIAAVIWQESGGNPSAYSKSGAVGLMQVMPRDGIASTFQCINGPCFTNRPSISELEKPNFNIKYGTGMIAGLLNKHGSLREALKFYGPMNVGYYYADKVLNIYQAYSS